MSALSGGRAGQSGNAFVTHEQAVIGEIFDACSGDPGHAALGGFLALPPELRGKFQRRPAAVDDEPDGAGVRPRARSARAILSGLGGRALYLQCARPDVAPHRTCRHRQPDAAPGAMGWGNCILPDRRPPRAVRAISKAHWKRRAASICRSALPGEGGIGRSQRRRQCRVGQRDEPGAIFPMGRRPAGAGIRWLPPASQPQPGGPAKGATHPAGDSRNDGGVVRQGAHGIGRAVLRDQHGRGRTRPVRR